MISLRQITKYFYPRTILDIGAHVGEFHVYAQHFFPRSYVFSIEASEDCEQQLRMVTDQYQIALLTAEEREYDFYTRKDLPGATGDSIYKENTIYYNEENLKVVRKQGRLLDSLFPRGFVFDLIKMDTQGSELDIIRGGMSVCSRAQGILLEVTTQEYNTGAPLKDEVITFMKNINFVPVEILQMELHPVTNAVIQENILFIKDY